VNFNNKKKIAAVLMNRIQDTFWLKPMPRAMISWPSREQQSSGTVSSYICAEIELKLRLEIKHLYWTCWKYSLSTATKTACLHDGYWAYMMAMCEGGN
jgi:hypothetical protein